MFVEKKMKFDYVVIGGGIVGISTAWQLNRRYPEKRLLLIEKEDRLAAHQTGHNSGVIHAGVYYEPGSLKAKLCKEGAKKTKIYCRENNIAFNQCGKLLVATNKFEHARMESLFKRCHENEIDCDWLTQKELKEREPNISGTGAIFVKDTAIVDYSNICTNMMTQFLSNGGALILNEKAVDIQENDTFVEIITERNRYQAGYLICCAGLMADRIVEMHGLESDFKIIPFRGEYYRLPSTMQNLINHLIYPIPDPALPFLGIHLTRMIDGSVTVGPNAVFGWKREGYGRINISYSDVADMLCFKGFWKLLRKNISTGIKEMKNSIWKYGYLNQVRKYCPKITINDLLPHPTGIRAQAVLSDGTLVHDFLFMESSRSLHVCNAPSPAATSSIPIGAYICDKVKK